MAVKALTVTGLLDLYNPQVNIFLSRGITSLRALVTVTGTVDTTALERSNFFDTGRIFLANSALSFSSKSSVGSDDSSSSRALRSLSSSLISVCFGASATSMGTTPDASLVDASTLCDSSYVVEGCTGTFSSASGVLSLMYSSTDFATGADSLSTIGAESATIC